MKAFLTRAVFLLFLFLPAINTSASAQCRNKVTVEGEVVKSQNDKLQGINLKVQANLLALLRPLSNRDLVKELDRISDLSGNKVVKPGSIVINKNTIYFEVTESAMVWEVRDLVRQALSRVFFSGCPESGAIKWKGDFGRINPLNPRSRPITQKTIKARTVTSVSRLFICKKLDKIFLTYILQVCTNQ
jgi:hypothetical protein